MGGVRSTHVRDGKFMHNNIRNLDGRELLEVKAEKI